MERLGELKFELAFRAFGPLFPLGHGALRLTVDGPNARCCCGRPTFSSADHEKASEVLSVIELARIRVPDRLNLEGSPSLSRDQVATVESFFAIAP